MKIVLFPVYKYTWENPLDPPGSSSYLFVWSGEQDQGWDQKELGKAARAPPAPPAQIKATGWYLPSSFAFTAVYT